MFSCVGPKSSRHVMVPQKRQPTTQDFPTVKSPTNQNASLLLNATNLDESSLLLSQDNDYLADDELLEQQDEDEHLLKSVKEVFLEGGATTLQEWMEARTREISEFAITVREPNIIKKALGRTSVEYTIRSSKGEVKRRFRDFMSLHDGLVERYPGALVPPLLQKKPFLGGKTDAWFIKKRTLLLERFVIAVSRHVFFGAEDIFVDFITNPERFNRKFAWQSRSTLLKQNKLSIAAKRWVQYVVETPSPPLSEALVTIETALVELEASLKSFNNLKAALKVHALQIGKYAQATNELANAVRSNQHVESQLALLGGGIKIESNISALFEKLQKSFVSHSDVFASEPEENFKAIGCRIRYEILIIEALIAAIKKSKTIVIKHQNAMKTYRDAKDESFKNGGILSPTEALPVPEHEGGLGGGGNNNQNVPPTVRAAENNKASVDQEKARQKLQKLRIQAITAQRDLRRVSVGLIKYELEEFKKERIKRVEVGFQSIGQVYRRQSEKLLDIWKDASAPSLNALEMIEDEKSGDGSSRLSRRTSQLRVTHDFKAEHADELDVAAGEILEGAPTSDSNWYVVKSKTTGKVGLVPINFVELLDDNERDSLDDDLEPPHHHHEGDDEINQTHNNGDVDEETEERNNRLIEKTVFDPTAEKRKQENVTNNNDSEPPKSKKKTGNVVV